MEAAKERIRLVEANGSTLLDLSNLGLTQYPKLPLNINTLILNDNKFTTLPELTTQLTDLYIDNNELSEIDELPINLELLSCVNNKITKIENIPDSLKLLDCRYNLLINEPAVPKMCKSFIRPIKLTKPQETATPETATTEILDVPEGAENSLTDEEIKDGNALVDFHDELKHERYYLKSTYDSLKTPKLNPQTRQLIKETKAYIARVKKTLKNTKTIVKTAPKPSTSTAVKPVSSISKPNETMLVAPESENSISMEEIKDGDTLVDFQDESKHQRYYLKSTFDRLPTPKLNPQTRAPITNTKVYIAKVNTSLKKGGKRAVSRKKRI